MVKYLFLLATVFFFKFSNAQEKNNDFGLGLTYHYGFLSPHSQMVNEIIKNHIHITELSLFRKTNGEKQWQQYFNYPTIGLSAIFFNTGNPESLGNIYGVFPFVDFPLNNWKVQWHIRFGYGAGFVEKPFNKETNYKNLVIGSHVNALIYFNTHWNIPITEKIDFSAGVSLTHLSNGSLKRPNLGINMFTLNSGISYYFGAPVVKSIAEVEKRPRETSHLVLANFGLKEVDKIGGKKYMIYNTSYNLMRSITNKSSFGVGADFIYNSSLEPLVLRLQNEDNGKISNFRMGISGIYSLDMGSLSLLFQTGRYLYTTYEKDGNIYSRIGSRYRINKKVFVNLSLTTHFFVADYIEYGIGYRIH
ncbi:MAG: hypothetical protein KFKLKKLM_01831 [Flavobacteriales bacterium]|nr:hypothetical protein [Flavobacteriales bacterium]